MYKRFHFTIPSKSIFCLLFALLTISACATVPEPAAPPARPVDVEDIVFRQAQEMEQKDQPNEAIGQYSRYLEQFPQGRHAASAWLRLGSIYQKQGSLDAAQAFYRSAIEKFPHTAAAIEAQSFLLDILIVENRPYEAAELAGQMLDEALDERMRQSVMRRLSKMHQHAGDASLSVWLAYLLYKQSPPDEKGQWESRIKEDTADLRAADIEQLWDRLDDKVVRSYLMYRYGVIQFAQGNEAQALELLTCFRNGFPGHPFEKEASELIESITAKLSFTPYTLGCLLPLSGAYEAYGRRVLNAVEMALSLLPSDEKAPSVKLVVEDAGSDDSTSIQGVRKLAQAGVGAIIGPITTAPAAAREAQKLNIPIVTFTQKADIAGIGDFVFRHFLTPQSQVQTLVDYFIHRVRQRKFAVLYPDEIYGRTFMALFRDEVVRQGGRMVVAESYSPEQTDFAENIKKLIGNKPLTPADQSRPGVLVGERPHYPGPSDAPDRLDSLVPDPVARLSGLYYKNPDQDRSRGKRVLANVDFEVLFIPDAPKAAGLILPQLAYYDIEGIYLVGTNLWHSRQLLDMAREYAQGAVLVDGFDKESAAPVVRSFVETYRSIYNTDPELMEAFAFDTANLLISLLSKPDIRLRSEIRDLLKQTVLEQGVTGATSFAADGEPIKKWTLLRIKGDRFIEIQ